MNTNPTYNRNPLFASQSSYWSHCYRGSLLNSHVMDRVMIWPISWPWETQIWRS